jgi:hypothetical protein
MGRDKNHDVTTIYFRNCIYLTFIVSRRSIGCRISVCLHIRQSFSRQKKHPDTNRKIVKKRACSFGPCSFSKPSTRLHRTSPHAIYHPLSLAIKQQIVRIRAHKTSTHSQSKWPYPKTTSYSSSSASSSDVRNDRTPSSLVSNETTPSLLDTPSP